VRAALVALVALAACSPAPQVPPTAQDEDGPAPGIVEPIRPGDVPPLYPFWELGCEWGCPSPFPVLIAPELDFPDAGTTVDAIPAADVPPLDCDRAYHFNLCCGDGTCQDDESAFFCPSDC